MGPLMVVRQEPTLADGTDLVEGFEEVGVEDLLAVGPVESFDVRILVRLAWLNVVDADATYGAPIDEDLGEQFRPVVDRQPGCRTGDRFPLGDGVQEAGI